MTAFVGLELVHPVKAGHEQARVIERNRCDRQRQQTTVPARSKRIVVSLISSLLSIYQLVAMYWVSQNS